MSELEVFKRIIIRDRNGKIKFDSGLEPSNSFVIAFLEHLHIFFAKVSDHIEDTDNVDRIITLTDLHSIDAPDNNSGYGIVVGTGDIAETNTDHALETRIGHGTSEGTLDYGVHSFTAPDVVGDNVDLVVSRDFYNGSGASITVKEIGAYCRSKDETGEFRNFCILRDVLGTPDIVDDTETLTVQYTFRTTV